VKVIYEKCPMLPAPSREGESGDFKENCKELIPICTLAFRLLALTKDSNCHNVILILL